MEKELSYSENIISFVVSSYDEIFSKFDPRDYSKRSISEDFIDECKKVATEKEKNVHLDLYIKTSKRDKKIEEKIKKRLKNHFEHHAEIYKKDIKQIKRKGIRWFIFGTLFMVFATYMTTFNGFLFKLLEIIFTPAGWFSFWEGLGKIFIDTNQKESDIDFNIKMSTAKISFFDY